VTYAAAFVAITVAGPRRNRTGFPDALERQNNAKRNLQREKQPVKVNLALCQKVWFRGEKHPA
jgi:hypothetical protein